MKCRRIVGLAVLLGSLVQPVTAEPYLVRDIATEPSSGGSSPQQFTAVGDIAYFVTFREDSVAELWVTDGTEAETRRVIAFEDAATCDVPEQMWSAGAHLLFRCNLRLWRSDGTADGTYRLGDSIYQRSHVLLRTSGRLLFKATDAEHGDRLWVSDFTRQGTRPFFDLHPGQGDPFVLLLAGLDDHTAVFIAETEEHGLGLWRTNGTPAGTNFLHSLETDTSYFVGEGSGRLFFRTKTAAAGTELWTTDGSPDGTHMVRDVTPGPESTAQRSSLQFSDGVVTFLRVDQGVIELWRSDGTVAGTFPVRSFLVDPHAPEALSWEPLGARDGVAYWLVDDGVHGLEPWRTDGTVTGTELLGDVCPGACGQRGLPRISWAGGRGYFTAEDPLHGREPRTFAAADGALELVGDLCPGPCSSGGGESVVDVEGIAVFSGRAAQGADDDVLLWGHDGSSRGAVRLTSPELVSIIGPTPGTVEGRAFFSALTELGDEPWVTDGTPEGTRMLADLGPTIGADADPRKLTVVEDTVYFFASEDGLYGAKELWASDGTEGGTRRLTTDLALRDSNLGDTRVVGHRFFFATATYRPELWVSDGTRRGTHHLYTTTGAIHLDRGVTVNDELFLILDGRLWSTDGTSPVLTPRSPEELSLDHAVDRPLAAISSAVYFAGFDGVEAWGDLWRLDTVTGTSERLLDGPGFDSPRASGLVAVDDVVYFAASDPTHGRELWRTDGTTAGTLRVADLTPGEGESSDPSILSSAQGIIYFTGEGLDGLWRSDGTAAGTWQTTRGLVVDAFTLDGGVLVRRREGADESLLWSAGLAGDAVELATWDDSPALDFLVRLADLAIFSVATPEGPRLWRTDGTVEGTVELGLGRASIDGGLEVAVVGDRLFFVGGDGSDLWRSDGTQAGTVVVQSFWTDARVAELVPSDGHLFFAASDRPTGRELWAMPIWDLFSDETTTLRLGDLARFTVEVEWGDGTRSGRGKVAPLRSADSGLFWFFSGNNWELLVKVLDGCEINDRFWVFAAATTTVEYTLVVTDTWTGEERRWTNPLGQPAAPVADTDVFATCSAGGGSNRSPATSSASPAGNVSPLVKTACPDGVGLCLGSGGRYRVTVAWDDGTRSGSGTPVAGSRDTGLFWFFSAKNWEMLVKVLDGCAINGRRWVFAAATTTVGYELRVEDTLAGWVATYGNPLGRVADTVTDTDAFPCD